MYLYVTLGWYDLVVYSNGRRAGDIVGRTDVKGNHTFIKNIFYFFNQHLPRPALAFCLHSCACASLVNYTIKTIISLITDLSTLYSYLLV